MTSKQSVTHSTFVIERSYPASPARVYAALSQPEEKKKWFSGPPEWGPDQHEMEFRVGGRDTSRGGPPGGKVYSFAATYQDIVPEQRIVYTYEMHMDDQRISVSVATYELAADGKGPRLILTEQGAYLDGLDTAEMREAGTRQLLDTLGASLNAAKA